MKNLNTLLVGVLCAVVLPFGALLLSGQMQLGKLGRAAGEEGGALFPPREPGLAIQGREIYRSLGCISCHTQQVRPTGQGSDIARAFGLRPSVARDYVLQPQVMLGERRIGPDLANYSARNSTIDTETLLTNPESSGAVFHPNYRFIDANARAALVAYLKSLRQDYPSPEAKLKQ